MMVACVIVGDECDVTYVDWIVIAKVIRSNEETKYQETSDFVTLLTDINMACIYHIIDRQIYRLTLQLATCCLSDIQPLHGLFNKRL